MGRHGRTVVTPEAVVLHLDTATVGSRLLAGMVDVLVIGVTLLLGAFVLGQVDVGGMTVWIFVSLAALYGTIGYFALLEALWDGQTVGKRSLGLRVVTTEGGPAPTSAVLARNLVRVVDLLPGLPLVGMVAILVTRDDQRLGDLAAGTLVVRRAKTPEPSYRLEGQVPEWAVALDLSGLTDADRQLLRSYVSRRHDLTEDARRRLAGSLASRLHQRVPGLPPSLGADAIVLGIALRTLQHG